MLTLNNNLYCISILCRLFFQSFSIKIELWESFANDVLVLHLESLLILSPTLVLLGL